MKIYIAIRIHIVIKIQKNGDIAYILRGKSTSKVVVGDK
jgi:hypothetical protein